MADFAQKNDLDLRFGGSTLGDFGYFYDVELPYIYKCLNSLRRNQVSPVGESLEPAAHMFKVEDEKLYIRDSDNQSWIFLLDLAYRGGLFERGQSLIKNTDLAGNTAETRAGKIAKYDDNGQLPADITGSAASLVGHRVDITGIEDGQTLVYSSATGTWIPADRSSAVGEGKTLTIRDNLGVIGTYNGGSTTEVEIPVSGLLPNTTYSYGSIAYTSQLATNVGLICVQAGTTPATIPTLADQDIYTIGTAVFQKMIITPRNILLRNQAVSVGEIRFTDKIASNLYLECMSAGSTAGTFPSFVGAGEGATVTDGTVIWRVRRLSGVAGTLSISDNSGSNTGTATAINATGSTVIALPATINANVQGNVTGNVTGNVSGNVTGNVSGSSGSCTGNAATATKVKSKTILTVNSFSSGVLNLSTFS